MQLRSGTVKGRCRCRKREPMFVGRRCDTLLDWITVFLRIAETHLDLVLKWQQPIRHHLEVITCKSFSRDWDGYFFSSTCKILKFSGDCLVCEGTFSIQYTLEKDTLGDLVHSTWKDNVNKDFLLYVKRKGFVDVWTARRELNSEKSWSCPQPHRWEPSRIRFVFLPER